MEETRPTAQLHFWFSNDTTLAIPYVAFHMINDMWDTDLCIDNLFSDVFNERPPLPLVRANINFRPISVS